MREEEKVQIMEEAPFLLNDNNSHQIMVVVQVLILFPPPLGAHNKIMALCVEVAKHHASLKAGLKAGRCA